MGPRTAAEIFLARFPEAAEYRVTLYGSLAATGKGHLTDATLRECFGNRPLTIQWRPSDILPFHPNGMRFDAFTAREKSLGTWTAYSVGGGKVVDEETALCTIEVYPQSKLSEILKECAGSGSTFWEYVDASEGKGIWDYLADIWPVMKSSIDRGLEADGVLPGVLHLPRQASRLYRKATLAGEHFRRTGLLAAFAHAVSEENAGGGLIVTAPTCGACGVLPSVLRYLQETVGCSDRELLRALATAGLIGNLVKHNASISGAEVGCQGEVGTACSMAAAAAAQLLGGSIRQIEYAAEMGMEHHLGLTCDPVAGLVQIPCIERNAHAATRALTCADYAIYGDGSHRVSFDVVVRVMSQTGRDLPSLYRETASGGLARALAEEGSPNSTATPSPGADKS
jgi:L-serine dehydratase